jgi:anti-sigma factor RsiW
MTCTMHGRGFESQIDDYVDGTLAEAARAALEAHLALCPACRALASDLGAIRAASLALERHVPPPHVWTRLSASIDGGTGQTLQGSWLGLWQPFASAAAGVVLVAALWWTGDRLTPPEEARLAARAGTSAYPDALAVTYRDAEEHYATAIEGLERITTSEQTALDPATADVLQANLTVIDRAIVESRAALETEPQSHVAQESLFEALRHKVALLQDTLALINEMRKGNEEGAARILSGLNP